LVKLCHIKRSGPIFFETQYSLSLCLLNVLLNADIATGSWCCLVGWLVVGWSRRCIVLDRWSCWLLQALSSVGGSLC